MAFRESNLARNLPASPRPEPPRKRLKVLRGRQGQAPEIADHEIEDLTPEETKTHRRRAANAAFEELRAAEPRIEAGARQKAERRRLTGAEGAQPENEITEIEELTPEEEAHFAARARRREEGERAFKELRAADEKAPTEAQWREQILARIREREERIEAMKRNIAEIRANTERMEAEAKAREDAEGAAQAKKITAALEEQDARIEELRGLERSIAAGQVGLEERMREGALLRDEGGEIIGLKNVFEVAPGDVLRATAPALRRIQERHLWAQDHLRGGWRNRALQDLEAEVQRWAQMAEKAVAEQEAGNKGEDERPSVENLFYEHPKAGEVPVVMQEAIARSPMETLHDRSDAIAERERELAAIFERERDVYYAALNSLSRKQSAIEALEEMQQAAEAMDGAYAHELKRLEVEYEGAKRALAGGDVDERGKMISRNLERAEGRVKQLKLELKTFKGERGLKQQLEAAEERVMELRGERNLWRESPRREFALNARREQLQGYLEHLSDRIAQVQAAQRANREGVEARAAMLADQTREIDESALLKQLEILEAGFIGAGSDYYDARQEQHAVLKEILRRAMAEAGFGRQEAA